MLVFSVWFSFAVFLVVLARHMHLLLSLCAGVKNLKGSTYILAFSLVSFSHVSLREREVD